MIEVGKLIAEVVSHSGSQATLQEARRRVKMLTDRHPLYTSKQPQLASPTRNELVNGLWPLSVSDSD